MLAVILAFLLLASLSFFRFTYRQRHTDKTSYILSLIISIGLFIGLIASL